MRWSKDVIQDERTLAVENASYRLAYWLMSYGLLAATMYRSFVLDQQSWDLLGLVILGGVATTVFRGSHRALPRWWTVVSALAVVLALIIALIFVRTSTVR